MTEFSKLVYAMGRGPSKGRNLDQSEAEFAMSEMLAGRVDPHAAGALLMLMRYRGETPAEIAGFIKALRRRITGWQSLETTIDWPSYAAGRTRGLPWFLLAAKLLARSGERIFLHGWNSHQNHIADVRNNLEQIEIQTCTDAEDAKSILAKDGLVYCPLETMDSDALEMMQLRAVLGLRSAVNTALRGYNPTAAPVTLQGVFHPSYRQLQLNASLILNQDTFAVVKGGGGEFEVNPSKDTEVFFHTGGKELNHVAPARFENGQKLAAASTDTKDLNDLWFGRLQNEFAKNVVLSTASVALQARNPELTFDDAFKKASELWEARFT